MIPPVHLQPIEISSAHYGGERPATVGVVIHSTRGGRGAGWELLSTVNHLLYNPLEVSAHAVVGRSGVWWQLVHPALSAYHARELNTSHLSIELEQGVATDDYTDEQYTVAAYIVRDWAERYGFAVGAETVVGHDQTSPGRRDGKTDPGPRFDWAHFLALCHDSRLALDERFRPYASETYGDLLDAANTLYGIARFANQRNQAGLLLLDQARAELGRAT